MNAHETERGREARRPVVDRFLRAVADHVRANHDVAFYADLLRVHPDYLSRAVKRQTGRGAKALIQETLAAEARRLLVTGMPVQQVAGRIGFESPAYFSRFYHRVVGETPTETKETYNEHDHAG